MASRLWVLASGDRIRTAQQRAAADWKALFLESLRQLEGGDSFRPPVLLLDELVFFLGTLSSPREKKANRRRRVLDFLSALSELCVAAGARVVVAGSLELSDYLRDEMGLRSEELPPLLASFIDYPVPLPTFKSRRLEMRRVLLGTGLVVAPAEFDWLVENADLASPFAALRFLDQLAAKTRADGLSGATALEAELDNFLRSTEAFKDFVHRLERKSRALPGAQAGLEEALDRLAQAPEEEGLPMEIFRAALSGVRPGEADRLVDWLVETFPIRRQGDRVLLASRLFRRWWLNQLAGVDLQGAGQ
jgi:hypothetical protein